MMSNLTIRIAMDVFFRQLLICFMLLKIAFEEKIIFAEKRQPYKQF